MAKKKLKYVTSATCDKKTDVLNAKLDVLIQLQGANPKKVINSNPREVDTTYIRRNLIIKLALNISKIALVILFTALGLDLAGVI